MKLKIFKYKKVTSTNDMAINLIKDKKNKYGFVYANTQTKGRGTRGKKWVSKIGNLFGSIFFQLKKNYPPFNEFAIISPVIIANVLKKFCKNKHISIKWPNDILVGKKKICGILQEVITINTKKFLIIGIGINIASSPNIKKKYLATNIFSEVKKKPSIKEIIDQIIHAYERFFYQLSSYKYEKFKKKAKLL